MLSEKLGKRYKSLRNKAGKLIILGIAYVKIGDIKNYANKEQIYDLLDMYRDFKEFSKEEKEELVNDLDGFSLWFYKIRLKDEWVFCD